MASGNLLPLVIKEHSAASMLERLILGGPAKVLDCRPHLVVRRRVRPQSLSARNPLPSGWPGRELSVLPSVTDSSQLEKNRHSTHDWGSERNGLFATVIFRELVFAPWCLIQAW